MVSEAELQAVCCDLIAELALVSGKVQLRVAGASMVPVLWPGDQITVRLSDSSKLGPDAIVVFRQSERLVVHRVIRRMSDRIVTRGDARLCCDRPVKATEVLGRVESIRRNGRPVRMQPRFWQRVAALVLRHSGGSTRVFLRLGPWIQKIGFAEAA